MDNPVLPITGQMVFIATYPSAALTGRFLAVEDGMFA
ncbi:MAG: hypothetical protein JWM80_4142 [Cyanobacteria bacterium RYN_339]|nr:hypothetical protein [Cyanobacteria bacterium RYN_339]